ncbi:MAG: hypothetical protein IJ433_01165 [Ruminococcus sp.]|nr:hypothetical protein [Ruminococcus sp.]
MKKKQTTSLMIKAIMLLLALIIMIFAASLAWFAPPDQPVYASGLSISANSTKEFEMAVGAKCSDTNYDYKVSKYSKELDLTELELDSGDKFNALVDFSPIDVTGDGVTLVRPSLGDKNSDIDRTSAVYSTVTQNREYISFDLYFKCSEECQVVLDKESFVRADCETEVGDGSLVSLDGTYSKDAIVGAIRVAFVNYSHFTENILAGTLASEPSLLWLPRPDVFLDAGEGQVGTLYTDVQTGEHYYKIQGENCCDTYTHHYYSYTHPDGQGDYDYEGTVTNPSNTFVCNVDTEIDGAFYGKTQVNIWVEGCDAEARRSLSGGKFYINFDFAAN